MALSGDGDRCGLELGLRCISKTGVLVPINPAVYKLCRGIGPALPCVLCALIEDWRVLRDVPHSCRVLPGPPRLAQDGIVLCVGSGEGIQLLPELHFNTTRRFSPCEGQSRRRHKMAIVRCVAKGSFNP